MAGSRLYSRETPTVRRLPEVAEGHFYRKGQLTYSHRIEDSEVDIYVCLKSHTDGADSDYKFFDSDNRLANTKLWLHWASSRLLDSEMSFASINQKIRRAGHSFDSDMVRFDSDILWVRTTIPLLPDSETVDSDLRVARADIAEILTNKITDFVDSDAVNNNIIVWDSDAQIYVTKLRVLTVNGQKPDANGNIVPTLLKVLVGSRDFRPDSDDDATIFITSGDSEYAEGSASIYSSKSQQWESIVNPDRAKLDSDFMRLDGTSKLAGPLFLVDDSDNDQYAVTKYYVDKYVKNSKQDSFFFSDSDAAFNDDTADSETFVVRTNKAVLSFFDGINTSNIGEPAVDIMTLENPVFVGNKLTIDTQCFSPFVPSQLTITENGVGVLFVVDSDNAVSDPVVSGVAPNFALKDGRIQSFSVTIPSYSAANQYQISCRTHEGETLTVYKTAGSSTWFAAGITNDYGTY